MHFTTLFLVDGWRILAQELDEHHVYQYKYRRFSSEVIVIYSRLPSNFLDKHLV